MAITDESRALRHHLLEICSTYCIHHADKDAVDFRLGSPEPYEETAADMNPEAVYETESFAISHDVRAIIIRLMDIAQEIRRLEEF